MSEKNRLWVNSIDEDGDTITGLKTRDLGEALSEAIRLYDDWVTKNPGGTPEISPISISVQPHCNECEIDHPFRASYCLNCGNPLSPHPGYSILDIVDEWKRRHPDEGGGGVNEHQRKVS